MAQESKQPQCSICEHIVNHCESVGDDPYSMVLDKDKEALCWLCPVYNLMRHWDSELTQENLDHFDHFSHGYRPFCRHNNDCEVFVRLQAQEKLTIADWCHRRMFGHPPRPKGDKLSDGFCPLQFRTKERVRMRSSMSISGFFAQAEYKFFGVDCDGDLPRGEIFIAIRMLAEVQANNLESTLTNDSGSLAAVRAHIEDISKKMRLFPEWWNQQGRNGSFDDFCTETDLAIDEDIITIVRAAKEKMAHPRAQNVQRHCSHFSFVNILSIMLYTNSNDLNQQLSAEMRREDYRCFQSWPYLIFTMSHSIQLLHDFDSEFKKIHPVFSGITGVRFTGENEVGRFAAFTSASFDRFVADIYCGGEGVVLEVQPVVQRQIDCCDVSWISNFSDEREVLFATFMSPAVSEQDYRYQSWRVDARKSRLEGNVQHIHLEGHRHHNDRGGERLEDYVLSFFYN